LGYIEVAGVFSPGATGFIRGEKCRKFFNPRPATFARGDQVSPEAKKKAALWSIFARGDRVSLGAKKRVAL